MITISISKTGEIVVSQENAEERAVMYQTYEKSVESDDVEAAVERFRNGRKSAGGEEDNSYPALSAYKEAWAEAVSLAALAYENDEIEQFFGANIEGWSWVATPEAEVHQPEIRPVQNSGELEKEIASQDYERGNNNTWDPLNSGQWTMSHEELQSRLDESYNRGRRDGLTDRRQTSRGTLERFTEDFLQQTYGEQHTRVDADIPLVVYMATRLGFEVTD